MSMILGFSQANIIQQTYVDQAPYVTRRLGLATLPLAVVAVLVCTQALGASITGASQTDAPSFVLTVQWTILILMFWFW